MTTNHYFVIYRLTFPNGQYYIGKAKDYERRMRQHQQGKFNGVNLKERVAIDNGRFTSEVLVEAPSSFSEDSKQVWMDNMERLVIHNESKRVYDTLMGSDSRFADYSPYKDIVNKVLVNTQLY